MGWAKVGARKPINKHMGLWWVAVNGVVQLRLLPLFCTHTWNVQLDIQSEDVVTRCSFQIRYFAKREISEGRNVHFWIKWNATVMQRVGITAGMCSHRWARSLASVTLLQATCKYMPAVAWQIMQILSGPVYNLPLSFVYCLKVSVQNKIWSGQVQNMIFSPLF